MSVSVDPATLFLCVTVICIAAALTMFNFWRVHRQDIAVRHWMLGYVCIALSCVPFALGPSVPVFYSRGLGNSIGIVGAVLIYAGTAHFLHRPAQWRLLAVVCVPALIVNAYWGIWEDSLAYRVAACMGAAGLALGLAGRDLWFSPPGPERPLFRFVAICWALYLALVALRAAAIFQLPPDAALADVGNAQTVYFLGLQAAVVMTAMGYVLIAGQRLQLRLDELASKDTLTGLLNRRAFHQAANRASGDKPSAVLVMDLDQFKSINDRHGHAAGDKVLCQTAATIETQLRKGDVFARAGGEEFWLLLPDMNAAAAMQTASRLRQAVENQQAETGITTSIGVAMLAPMHREADVEAALVIADRALYAAKAAGRNRVELA